LPRVTAETQDAKAKAREALLEPLAISGSGARLRAAVVVIAAAAEVWLLGEPILLVCLAVLIVWNSVLVGPLERRFVVPLVQTDIERARFRRAAMVFLGLALTQMLPLLVWLEGTTFSAVIATCWILSAATQVFVYYSRDRM